MFKGAMVSSDSTVAQQLVDNAKNTVVFNIKEERNQTSYSSHHMWPPDCQDKTTRHRTSGMPRLNS